MIYSIQIAYSNFIMLKAYLAVCLQNWPVFRDLFLNYYRPITLL